jgi:hypothetical protein
MNPMEMAMVGIIIAHGTPTGLIIGEDLGEIEFFSRRNGRSINP